MPKQTFSIAGRFSPEFVSIILGIVKIFVAEVVFVKNNYSMSKISKISVKTSNSADITSIGDSQKLITLKLPTVFHSQNMD